MILDNRPSKVPSLPAISGNLFNELLHNRLREAMDFVVVERLLPVAEGDCLQCLRETLPGLTVELFGLRKRARKEKVAKDRSHADDVEEGEIRKLYVRSECLGDGFSLLCRIQG